MKIGYTHVFPDDSNLDLQIDALLTAGCKERMIYRDIASGKNATRAELEQCLRALCEGGT